LSGGGAARMAPVHRRPGDPPPRYGQCGARNPNPRSSFSADSDLARIDGSI